MFRTMAGSGGSELFDLEGAPAGAEVTIEDEDISDEVGPSRWPPARVNPPHAKSQNTDSLIYHTGCGVDGVCSAVAAAYSTEHAQDL